MPENQATRGPSALEVLAEQEQQRILDVTLIDEHPKHTPPFTPPKIGGSFITAPLSDALQAGQEAMAELRAGGDAERIRKAADALTAAADALRDVYAATSSFYQGVNALYSNNESAFEKHMGDASDGYHIAGEKADAFVGHIVSMDEESFDAFLSAIERMRGRDKEVDARIASSMQRSGASNSMTSLAAGASLLAEKCEKASVSVDASKKSILASIRNKLSTCQEAATQVVDIVKAFDENYGELKGKVNELQDEVFLSAKIALHKKIGGLKSWASQILTGIAKKTLKLGDAAMTFGTGAKDISLDAIAMAGSTTVGVIREAFKEVAEQTSKAIARGELAVEARQSSRYLDALNLALSGGGLKPLERQIKIFGNVNVPLPQHNETMLDRVVQHITAKQQDGWNNSEERDHALSVFALLASNGAKCTLEHNQRMVDEAAQRQTAESVETASPTL